MGNPGYHHFSTNIPPIFHSIRHISHHNFHLRAVSYIVVYSSTLVLGTFGGCIIHTPSILVIEKDEIAGAMIAGALEVTEFNIKTTTDTLNGLKKISESYPDAIIIATKLPRVNRGNALTCY